MPKRLESFLVSKNLKEKPCGTSYEAKDIQAKLAKKRLLSNLQEKIGPIGRTFGSTTNKKIAEELQKQFGIQKSTENHIQ